MEEHVFRSGFIRNVGRFFRNVDPYFEVSKAYKQADMISCI